MADRVGLVRSVRLISGRDITQKSGAAQHARQHLHENGQTRALVDTNGQCCTTPDYGLWIVGGPAVPVEPPYIPRNPSALSNPLPHPAPGGGHACVEQDRKTAGSGYAEPHWRVADDRAAGARISHGTLGVRERNADHAGVGRFQAIWNGSEKMVVTYDQSDADAALPGLPDRKPHRFHAADNAHAVVSLDDRGHAPIAQDRLIRIGADRTIVQPPKIEMDKPEPVGCIAADFLAENRSGNRFRIPAGHAGSQEQVAHECFQHAGIHTGFSLFDAIHILNLPYSVVSSADFAWNYCQDPEPLPKPLPELVEGSAKGSETRAFRQAQ